MPLILTLENISRDFSGVRALYCVDCNVHEGQIHGLIGPNASGKSTLFNVITGVYPATTGKIVFENCVIFVKGFPGVLLNFDMVGGMARMPAFLFQITNNEKRLVETFQPK